MQKNKTKLGIVTLMTTAIVCFIVAILGMGMDLLLQPGEAVMVALR